VTGTPAPRGADTPRAGSRRQRHLPVGVLLVAVALVLAACAPSSTPAQGGAGSRPSARTTLTVLAAASTRDAFTRIAASYEKAHPGVTVRLGFGGSSTLVDQVRAGAPADVLATASTTSMHLASGAVGPPVIFARNRLALVVPRANPAGIHSVADLADPEVRLVMCQPQVPCGATARTLLARAGVKARPVSLEPDVSATVTMVRLGEADAGFVYVTDLRAAGDQLAAVPLPPRLAVWTDYPIAVVTASPHRAQAAAFVRAVTGPDGQAVLRAAGFAPPR